MKIIVRCPWCKVSQKLKRKQMMVGKHIENTDDYDWDAPFRMTYEEWKENAVITCHNSLVSTGQFRCKTCNKVFILDCIVEPFPFEKGFDELLEARRKEREIYKEAKRKKKEENNE